MSATATARDRLGKVLMMLPFARENKDRMGEMLRIAAADAGSDTVIERLADEIRDNWDQLQSIATFRALLSETRAKVQSAVIRKDCPVCHGYAWLTVDILVTIGTRVRRNECSLLTEEQVERLRAVKLPANQYLCSATYPCWSCDAGRALADGDPAAAQGAERVRQWRERNMGAAW